MLTALAWAYLLHLDRDMSAAMEHDRMMVEMGMTMDAPWQTADVFLAIAMWAVMMVGMMTPSAAPVVLLFAGMHRAAGARPIPGVVFAFVAGYLLVWVSFSVAAALAQWALHQAALLSPMMTTSSASLGAGILIAAVFTSSRHSRAHASRIAAARSASSCRIGAMARRAHCGWGSRTALTAWVAAGR